MDIFCSILLCEAMEHMKLTWKTCLKIGVTAFLLFFAIYYWDAAADLIRKFVGALLPIGVGLILAYVVNIVMRFYEHRYFPRSEKPFVVKSRVPVCMLLSLVTLGILLAAIALLVAPELVACVEFIISQIAPTMNKILTNEFVVDVLPETILSTLTSVNWQELVSKAVQLVVNGIGDVANTLFTAISSVVSLVINVFLSFIFTIYLLLSRDKLISQGQRLLRTYIPKRERRIRYVCSVFNHSFRNFIVGQCTEAVILGVLCVIGMLIFNFPYAGMVGALVGFCSIIPIAGAYIGCIIGALMILTVSPLKALLFVVFIIVLQQLEGNLIYPKVVGEAIGLPAIWVLLAITIGGALLGILGMLLGVPFTAAVYRLIREDVERRSAASAPPAAPPAAGT